MEENKRKPATGFGTLQLSSENRQGIGYNARLQDCMVPLLEISQKAKKSSQGFFNRLTRISEQINLTRFQFRLPEMTPGQQATWQRRYEYFDRWKAAKADPENKSNAAVIYRGLSTDLSLAQLEDIGRRLGDPRNNRGCPPGSGKVANNKRLFVLAHEFVQDGMSIASAIQKAHKQGIGPDDKQPKDLSSNQIEYRRDLYNRMYPT